ncbi:PHB depolymerase family esterase [Gordonia sp. VNQ95]|uniref:alpha/beta hydrolase family esterase n=1 Tax=Gordonia TaxID=2053 RepID=UPI0032B4401E
MYGSHRGLPRIAMLRALTAVTLILGVVLGLLGVASPASAVTPGCGGNRVPSADTTHTTRVGGVTRTYRVHVPRGYTGRSSFPLVLAFYGHGEKSPKFERYTGLSDLPAIVIYPDATIGTDSTTSWQGAPYSSPKADDVAFTSTMLREIRASFCVDRNRTFAVGRSNGGGLVSMLTCRLSGEFAAYAIVNGAYYDQTWRACPGGRTGAGAPPLSVIDFHGTSDPIIHYDGGVRFGERYTPIPDVLTAWSRRNACLPAPVQAPLSATTTIVDYPLCAALGHEIVHYRITGAGHGWPGARLATATGPGTKVAATQLIWQFFGRHPRTA